MPTVYQRLDALEERVEQLENYNARLLRRYRELKKDYRQIMIRMPGRAAWVRGSRLRIPPRPYLLRRLGMGHDPRPDEE